MKKEFLTLSLIPLFFIILHPVYAQVTLKPTEVKFVTYTIELSLLSEETDYTNSKQFIALNGDKGRLDIFWNAKYNPDTEYPINVTCWLNCRNNRDITTCQGRQSCSVQGPPGPMGCTIFNPNFNYFSINNVTCRFSNPTNPELEYLIGGVYPQRVFYPIKYSVSFSGGTYLTGETIGLPVNFVSYSFLRGNYTALAYIQSTSFIHIDNSYNTTRILKYSEIDTVYPKITVIYAGGKTTLFIHTTANELPSCRSANDCPNIVTSGYQTKSCVQGKCYYIFTTEISSSYFSLPEYGMKELLLIFLLTPIIYLIILRLK